MMIVFNRGFAYTHIRVGALPLFVTEAVLGLSLLVILLTKEGRSFLGRASARLRLTYVIFGMLGLVMLKLLLRFQLDVYALRHSALGYYMLFALITYVFASYRPWRSALLKLVLIGTLLTAFVMLFVMAADINDYPILILYYQGVGAFLWIGLVALFLLSRGWVDFWQSPRLAFAFLVLASVGVLTGGRSFLLGMALCSGAALFLIRKKVNKTMIISLLGVLLVSVGFWMLRKNNVIQFKNQDVWQDTWASWAEMTDVEFGEEEELREAARAAGERRRLSKIKKDIAVPKNTNQEKLRKLGIPLYDFETDEIDDIYVRYHLALKNKESVQENVFLKDDNRLILMSPFLGPTFADRAYASKTNNAFWRLELWRLAITATFSNNFLIGFPLGVNVMYWAFSPHNYVDRTDMHNSHIAFFFRFGLIGFAIYCFLLCRIFWDLGKAFLAEKNFHYVACGLGLIFLLIMSSFNVILEGPFGAFPLWCLVGYSFALCQDKK